MVKPSACINIKGPGSIQTTAFIKKQNSKVHQLTSLALASRISFGILSYPCNIKIENVLYAL